ncbi:MAG: hypothetical protein KAV87_64385 [Desulfobacteraceae bacterium]|nr:hypothetical protein [Desulfobacteraceae bacterium]
MKNLVIHIMPEVSISILPGDSLQALELALKVGKVIKKLSRATTTDGGREIRIPLNYEL